MNNKFDGRIHHKLKLQLSRRGHTQLEEDGRQSHSVFNTYNDISQIKQIY